MTQSSLLKVAVAFGALSTPPVTAHAQSQQPMSQDTVVMGGFYVPDFHGTFVVAQLGRSEILFCPDADVKHGKLDDAGRFQFKTCYITIPGWSETSGERKTSFVAQVTDRTTDVRIYASFILGNPVCPADTRHQLVNGRELEEHDREILQNLFQTGKIAVTYLPHGKTLFPNHPGGPIFVTANCGGLSNSK